MKYLLLILLLMAGCGMVGEAAQGGTEAAGVVATAVIATPLVAILSWPIWSWFGGWFSVWMTGTERTRVVVEDGGAGLSIPSPTEAILGTGDNTMIWILAIIAFIALGGPAWALKKIKDAKAEDTAWLAAFNAGQAKDAAELQALRDRVALLEKMLAAKTIAA